MADYQLYVDESTVQASIGKRYFVMGGTIIKKSEYVSVENDLQNLKRRLWNSASGCEGYILHELDVNIASKPCNRHRLHDIEAYNRVFGNPKKVTVLYNGLSQIFKTHHLCTIGVCIDENSLAINYGTRFVNSNFTIAIQMLIEHYCHFLINNNSSGDICYESMQPTQNQLIQQRIYELKSLGTMYYSPATIQNHISEIQFYRKSDNLAGLQLADFVPNALGRHAANLKPKNVECSKTIRKQLYNGCIADERYKYGFKVLA